MVVWTHTLFLNISFSFDDQVGHMSCYLKPYVTNRIWSRNVKLGFVDYRRLWINWRVTLVCFGLPSTVLELHYKFHH